VRFQNGIPPDAAQMFISESYKFQLRRLSLTSGQEVEEACNLVGNRTVYM